MTDSEVTTSHNTESTSRRKVISRMALGSGIVVAGAVAGAAGAGATSGTGGWKRTKLTVDVAILGDTWRDSTPNYAADESDFRGYPFLVEGWIYPAGHIPDPGDGFVPTQDGSIGYWLCRGQTLVHTERLEPHVVSTQEFIFGPMAMQQLFAADNLTTTGTEGTYETDQVAERAVIGGTGQYMGATGQVAQSRNGFNTSLFTDGTGNAPNLQMSFDLLIPDI